MEKRAQVSWALPGGGRERYGAGTAQVRRIYGKQSGNSRETVGKRSGNSREIVGKFIVNIGKKEVHNASIIQTGYSFCSFYRLKYGYALY